MWNLCPELGGNFWKSSKGGFGHGVIAPPTLGSVHVSIRDHQYLNFDSWSVPWGIAAYGLRLVTRLCQLTIVGVHKYLLLTLGSNCPSASGISLPWRGVPRPHSHFAADSEWPTLIGTWSHWPAFHRPYPYEDNIQDARTIRRITIDSLLTQLWRNETPTHTSSFARSRPRGHPTRILVYTSLRLPGTRRGFPLP